jgi:LytS/YehU family sensor histidine kinase
MLAMKKMQKRSSRTKTHRQICQCTIRKSKNQLDPHFLFNSLNVLDSLIEENPKQAQQFTNSMSKFTDMFSNKKTKNWFR